MKVVPGFFRRHQAFTVLGLIAICSLGCTGFEAGSMGHGSPGTTPGGGGPPGETGSGGASATTGSGGSGAGMPVSLLRVV